MIKNKRGQAPESSWGFWILIGLLLIALTFIVIYTFNFTELGPRVLIQFDRLASKAGVSIPQLGLGGITPGERAGLNADITKGWMQTCTNENLRLSALNSKKPDDKEFELDVYCEWRINTTNRIETPTTCITGTTFTSPGLKDIKLTTGLYRETNGVKEKVGIEDFVEEKHCVLSLCEEEKFSFSRSSTISLKNTPPLTLAHFYFTNTSPNTDIELRLGNSFLFGSPELTSAMYEPDYPLRCFPDCDFDVILRSGSADVTVLHAIGTCPTEPR